MVSMTASQPALRSHRGRFMPNGVLGVIIFVMAEAMLFAGFLSAFSIARASAPAALWPPPGQPRLPAMETLLNTAALVLSGVLMAVAHLRVRRGVAAARAPLGASVVLGAAFVGLQGLEWVDLLKQGLSLTSSAMGSFFFLIVGCHALHAVVAILVLADVWRQSHRGDLALPRLWAAGAFWYFVVGMWPVIYATVYF